MKKILATAFAALLAASVCGCAHNVSTTYVKPLDPSAGIGNPAYLYGMCYALSERTYASNTTFDMKREVKLMANLGVTSVRSWMHLDDMLLDPVTVNGAKADAMHAFIAECRRYGIRVIGMSHTSFHEGTTRSGKPARDIDPESYYASWLYDYYLSWKTMSAEFPEIAHWEIDNEMNNPDFMTDISGAKVYSQDMMAAIATDMLYAASRGIKESAPTAERIMGGLTEPNGLGSGQNKSFLQKLYDNIASGEFGYLYGREEQSAASTDPDDYFTAACWHPYLAGSAFDAENFVKFNNEIYQVVLDNEGKHKKVYFTEMGFSDAQMSEEVTAGFIKSMFETVSARMPYVETVHYFKLFNVAARTWTGTVSRFGLFYDPDPGRFDYSPSDAQDRRTPGAPKKKAYAFQEAAGGTGSLDLVTAGI